MIAPTDLHPSPAPHFKTCVYVASNVNENTIEGSIAVGCDTASLNNRFTGRAHDHDHHVRFHNTKILSLPSLLDWLIRKASKMQFHTNSINREDGLILSRLLPQGAQETLL